MNYEEGREAILQNIEVAILTYKLAMAGRSDDGKIKISGMPESYEDRDRVSRLAAVISACVAQTGSETVNIEADAMILLREDFRYVVAAEKAFREERRARSEWIPVRERMPKHESVVLVFNDDGKYAICKYRDFDYDTCWNCWNIMFSPYDDDVWSVDEHGEIVAWMPLPEPYREEHES